MKLFHPYVEETLRREERAFFIRKDEKEEFANEYESKNERNRTTCYRDR